MTNKKNIQYFRQELEEMEPELLKETILKVFDKSDFWQKTVFVTILVEAKDKINE